jgi:hypothetical protein
MQEYDQTGPSINKKRIIAFTSEHGTQKRRKFLYSSQRHHSAHSIKIFFGHQRHDKAWVSHWACALDGGVVFGGTLRAYIENKGIIEIKAKTAYEVDEQKRPLP